MFLLDHVFIEEQTHTLKEVLLNYRLKNDHATEDEQSNVLYTRAGRGNQKA